MTPSLICSYYELAVVAHLESSESDSSVSVQPPKHKNRSEHIPIIKKYYVLYNVEMSLNPFLRNRFYVVYCFWENESFGKTKHTHTI